MLVKLSPQQVRKLILFSQRISDVHKSIGYKEDTLSVIEHLGYVQIDTLSVVERAHHHTLWNRNSNYNSTHLDLLLAEKNIFEYWSHAAAYLPMRDYRYTLPRKQAIKSGEEKHWYAPDRTKMDLIFKRIVEEGPLMAKDFDDKEESVGDWKMMTAKLALNYLFMQGDIMIAKRNGFHRVFEITERVLSSNIDTSMPTREEYARFLITRYLEANGLGLAAEMCYLLKKTKPLVLATLKMMLIANEVIEVKVGEMLYYALPQMMDLLNKPLPRRNLKILSPFDNLVIQRKRIHRLFDFDYQIECYVTEKKRQYGYFSLPILWQDKLVARMDCKANRKTRVLHIKHLALEPSLKLAAPFAQALALELKAFMAFNECDELLLYKVSPSTLLYEIQSIIKATH